MPNAHASSDWRSRICVDPAIHHGDACIAGTRVAASVIAASVADGDSVADILESYPQLKAEDIAAAVRLAADDELKKWR